MTEQNRGTLHEIIHFEIGHLPDGNLALLLSYAETPEALARRDMIGVPFGLSPAMAERLAHARLLQAKAPPAPTQ